MTPDDPVHKSLSESSLVTLKSINGVPPLKNEQYLISAFSRDTQGDWM